MAALGGVVVALVGFWLYLGPVSNAHAENFCSGVTLQPFGHNGDRCTAPNGGWVYTVAIETFERAGCEATENNGVLLDSWTCFGAHSTGQSLHASANWSHGIIRNNNPNPGATGVFSGDQNACPTQSCAP
jgi:hypothetical protein